MYTIKKKFALFHVILQPMENTYHKPLITLTPYNTTTYK